MISRVLSTKNKIVGKNMNKIKRNTEFVFMSSGLFEYLTDTESYIFSFVCYFAADKRKGNIFKRTTSSICKQLGYSSNTVRAAIESLVKKGFLERDTPVKTTGRKLKYNYIEEVSHYLKIGQHQYANKFAYWLSLMLDKLRDGTSNTYKAEISFYKVFVSALQKTNKQDKWKRNQSRHLHKAMALHGYLLNRIYWCEKNFRTSFSRSISYLSAEFQWSPNTIRRVINTLKSLGLIKYKKYGQKLSFIKVSMAEKISQGYEKLSTKILTYTNEVKEQCINVLNTPVRPRRGASPAEHAEFLRQMKARQAT